MKVVLATPLYPPEIGGPATYAKILEEELPKRGIEVGLVKFGGVRHLPKLVRHIAYYQRVLAASRDADVVLALDPISVGLPAMKAARRAGKPFVVKIVGDYAWEQGRQRFGVKEDLDTFVATKQKSFFVRMLQKIQTRVALHATRVVVPSEYLKGIICQWGIPKEKIEVIYNAVPPGAPGALPESLKNLPRPLVVSVGRLVPWKHIDGLIDSIDRLDQKYTSAFLVVVGDGPERHRLERYAKKKLGTFFRFTGALAHPETLALMRAADVLALNSSYEGFSHVLVEALALGTAIVATDIAGNRELIKNGENGILVPVGDIDALADALGDAILDGTLRARLIAGARKSAKRFSTETMLSRTSDVLRALGHPMSNI